MWWIHFFCPINVTNNKDNCMDKLKSDIFNFDQPHSLPRQNSCTTIKVCTLKYFLCKASHAEKEEFPHPYLDDASTTFKLWFESEFGPANMEKYTMISKRNDGIWLALCAGFFLFFFQFCDVAQVMIHKHVYIRKYV